MDPRAFFCKTAIRPVTIRGHDRLLHFKGTDRIHAKPLEIQLPASSLIGVVAEVSPGPIIDESVSFAALYREVFDEARERFVDPKDTSLP